MVKRPKAPPTTILPQEWKNPKPVIVKAPEVVFPLDQNEEMPIPYVIQTPPPLVPHVYEPEDAPPAPKPPEPPPVDTGPPPPFPIPHVPDNAPPFHPPPPPLSSR